MGALIFWQNIPSLHQAPLMRALARLWPGDVLVVTEQQVPAQRLAQGWHHPDFRPARLIATPSWSERQSLVEAYSAKDSVHIFSGLHAYPQTYRTLKLASRSDALIGVIVEAGRSDDGIFAWLRRLRYTLQGRKWSRRLDFMLAAGDLGVRWYQQRGFAGERIFPFGYFVAPRTDETASSVESLQNLTSDHPYRVMFVGRLSASKGMDLLLKALHQLPDQPWELSVIGDSQSTAHYKEMAATLGVAGRVNWHGILPNSSVVELMKGADTVILPSRYDGWGAVINESLMAGTPVIVSDACGAADLIRCNWLGRVFRADSVESLRYALHEAFCQGPTPPALRTRIRNWANETISPDAAARYLLSIIEHVALGGSRPVAPWHKECDHGERAERHQQGNHYGTAK